MPWIAKPLQKLSLEEQAQYRTLYTPQTPLSQTLAWGKAIETAQGNVITVFSPDQCAFALYHFNNEELAECTNGPCLNWNLIQDQQKLEQMLSTLVYAFHQAKPKVKKIKIKPRLEEAQFQFLEKNLSFPIDLIEKTQTLLVPVLQNEEDRWRHLSPRIRSEIKRSQKQDLVITTSEGIDGIELFWAELEKFYQLKKLFLPPLHWIQTFLIEGKKCGIESQRIKVEEKNSQSFCEILVLHFQSNSYYFFAHETRTPQCPKVSLNVIAQWEALRCASQNKTINYDLNGVLHPEQSEDQKTSYSGVDLYKRKFKGVLLNRLSPEIGFGG